MLNFQEMIIQLTQFWAEQGCLIHQGYDLEVGAGTFNPATFLRSLGPEPYAAVYVEPSRRPQDGRYGENPNRVQFYHQMQVILKPSPSNIQELYLQSLESIGFNLKAHDIRFVHDDWENPTIGAWGLGWEVWIDGMEITQFTYFQAVGGIPVKPVTGEITYGLERLAMYLQEVNSIFDLKWNAHIHYGQIYKRSEWEWSHYNFTEANEKMWLRHFDDFEKEAQRLIEAPLPIPAYDFVMKASHAFNILDARGVISVTERTGYISRIRALARKLAESYIKSREDQKFPLLQEPSAPIAPDVAPVSTAFDPGEREDFLLEIGSEEIPATFVPIGMSHLEKEMELLLKERGLPYDSLHVYGTPRRLAVLVKNLAGGTFPEKKEKKGPATRVAFDAQGQPTKAGTGFFRSIGLEPLTLDAVAKAKNIEIRNDYLFATIEKPGLSTRVFLANELAKLILRINFPKKMRWGGLDIEYARPLRWIVALYGKEEIPFVIGDLVSSRTSYGHRALAPKTFSVSHPSSYINALKDHFVLADTEERKRKILEQLEDLERKQKGKAVAAERVMAQVLHLTEWPQATLGEFDPAFLKAPKEVLIAEMVEHQKYFPLAGEDGSLLPYFVVVCNNMPSDLIRSGHQKALTPRLADGAFLYEEDLKTPLELFHKKLEAITFQKELGNMAEKAKRLVANVEVLHMHLPICDLEKAKRAAALCKADLASELVGEFPDLQGIAGRLYALHHKEDPIIAAAIEEHWMPRAEKAPLPKSPMGTLLSIADKIDNLLSCFALGLIPTSASDPYALRRQTLGMLKMVIAGKHYLPLPTILSHAFDHFCKNPALALKTKQKIEKEKENILKAMLTFIAARLRTVLSEHAFAKDEIEAVLSRNLQNPYCSYRLIAALHQFREKSHKQFLSLLTCHTRVKKILFSQNAKLISGWRAHQHKTVVTKENRYPPVDPHKLIEPQEKTLQEKVEEIKKQFHLSLLARISHKQSSRFGQTVLSDNKESPAGRVKLTLPMVNLKSDGETGGQSGRTVCEKCGLDRRNPQTHDYTAAFRLLEELTAPVSAFFDAVMVLDKDLALRTNRLALLQSVWDLYEELVDFGKIQELDK